MMRAFVVATALLSPASIEHIAMPMPAGFVIAHQETAQSGTIEERIPRGETVEKWSRMITLLKINTPAPAAVYATNFENIVRNACPGMKATRSLVTVARRNAVDGRMNCPLNRSTGKPETFFLRALSSGSAIYMVQVAFRHMPDPQETAWAQAQIQSAIFCATGSREPACLK